MNEKANLLIVGAGLTGLLIGQSVRGKINTTLIEKSRGVGGRMATRRTETAKFDHGAQFYAKRPPLETIHERWTSADLSAHWFDREEIPHFSGRDGMTSLAKNLAKDLTILLEKRVETIHPAPGGGWQVKLESGEKSFYGCIVFTCPLPQSLEILSKSGVAYDTRLDSLIYSKAVVGLFELKAASERLGGSTGYAEFETGSVFSVADQARKGVSKSPTITLTLSEKESETLYEATDEAAETVLRRELLRLDPAAIIKSAQVKRWRYNKPLTTYGSLFCEITPALFLAGDAFGGASLNGAARSAEAVAQRLFG